MSCLINLWLNQIKWTLFPVNDELTNATEHYIIPYNTVGKGKRGMNFEKIYFTLQDRGLVFIVCLTPSPSQHGTTADWPWLLSTRVKKLSGVGGWLRPTSQLLGFNVVPSQITLQQRWCSLCLLRLNFLYIVVYNSALSSGLGIRSVDANLNTDNTPLKWL